MKPMRERADNIEYRRDLMALVESGAMPFEEARKGLREIREAPNDEEAQRRADELLMRPFFGASTHP